MGSENKIEVSPGKLTAAGVAAFVAGAVVAGSAHYMGSARKLEEEGINPRLRLRALPVALRALAASTVLCGIVGVGGLLALQHSGAQVKQVAQVSTLHDAIVLAQQQRDLVRHEFQNKLAGLQSGSDQ